MKNLPINLNTFIWSLENENFNDIFKFYKKIYGINIRKAEVESMGKLLSNFNLSTKYLEGFHIGYTIPQISKEFDLIRLEEDRIINIELKYKATKGRIRKQLLQNEYYLSFLDKNSCLYSYIEKTNKLYKLENNKIIDCEFSKIEELLKMNLENIIFKNIDSFFNPSNYLVSPFNSTDKFLEGNYFLTNHQEYIKKIIVRNIKFSEKFNYFYIEGSSGTGKSLLVYDIAKSLKEINKEICIIHVGQLNDGHFKLIDNGWNIRKITELDEILKSKYDVLIIDEAQRLEERQVNDIISISQKNNIDCIFSMDPRQTMGRSKTREENISEYILSMIRGVNPNYREGILTDNIRSNTEIEEFIKVLFNNKKMSKDSISFENIYINYFKNIVELKEYCLYLKEMRNCASISYTTYDEKDPLSYLNIESKYSSHSIIGQEFENVYLNIDNSFYYKYDGKLSYEVEGKQPYYDPIQMAYQIGTRAKNKLFINILNNIELYRKCLEIISR